MSAHRSAPDQLTSLLRPDYDTGVWVVEIHGRATVRAEMDVRTIVTKCLTDFPAAIVLDLRDLIGAEILAPDLPALRRRALTAGTRLLCVAAEPLATRIAETVARWYVETYPTADEAMSAAQRQSRWLRLDLVPPHDHSASTARLAVGDFCLALGFPHLLTRVRIITSELVANAVEHAGGQILVTASAFHTLIHVNVADRSLRAPVERPTTEAAPEAASLDERGTGLRLVEQHATAWGTVTRQGGGKVVWATLRA
jgi:anti-sigma regulatory factor (Ser/Thr protein kinase)